MVTKVTLHQPGDDEDEYHCRLIFSVLTDQELGEIKAKEANDLTNFAQTTRLLDSAKSLCTFRLIKCSNILSVEVFKIFLVEFTHAQRF
jgi:hypothetical protein